MEVVHIAQDIFEENRTRTAVLQECTATAQTRRNKTASERHMAVLPWA